MGCFFFGDGLKVVRILGVVLCGSFLEIQNGVSGSYVEVYKFGKQHPIRQEQLLLFSVGLTIDVTPIDRAPPQISVVR